MESHLVVKSSARYLVLFVGALLYGCGGGSDSPPDSPGQIANKKPVAVADDAQLYKNRGQIIDVSANDSDEDGNVLKVLSVTQSQHANVIILADNTVQYTPHIDYVGQDSFSYTIEDEDKATAQATVTITVLDNIAPTALDDEYNLVSDVSLNLPVLINDSDPEHELLTIVSWQDSALEGVIVKLADNLLKYTPKIGFIGTETFTYVVEDPSRNQATATITLHIREPVVKIRQLDINNAETGGQDNTLVTYIADVSAASVDSKVGAIVPLGDMNSDRNNDILIEITEAGDIDGKTQNYFYSLWGITNKTYGTTLTLTDLLPINAGNGDRGRMFYRETSTLNNILQVGNIDLNNDSTLDQLFIDDFGLRLYFGKPGVVDVLIDMNINASVVYERSATDGFSIDNAVVMDFNTDGVQDIVLAGHRLEGCGSSSSVCKHINEVRVWFGPFSEQTSNPYNRILDGSNGFVIDGFDLAASPASTVPLALAVADFDHDGKNDLLIGGASELNTDDGNKQSGQVYVLWGGQDGIPATFNIAQLGANTAGLKGLRIGDSSAQTYSIGMRVISADDVNGDGIDDVLISYSIATQVALQKVVLLLGKSDWKSSGTNKFDLGTIANSTGVGSNITITTPGVGVPKFILSVNTLDINGDNHSDIALQSIEGQSIILGQSVVMPSVFSVVDNGGSWPNITIELDGLRANQGAATDINNDGFDDLFIVRNQANKKDAFLVYGGLHFGL